MMNSHLILQYNEELHYVEPCLNGTLVQADVTNKDVSHPLLVSCCFLPISSIWSYWWVTGTGNKLRWKNNQKSWFWVWSESFRFIISLYWNHVKKRKKQITLFPESQIRNKKINQEIASKIKHIRLNTEYAHLSKPLPYMLGRSSV